MMKIIGLLLQVIAVAIGGYVGLSLKSNSGGATHESDESGQEEKADNAHDEKKSAAPKEKNAKSKTKKKDKGGHGKGGYDEAAGDSSFMKFSRQFIVPVVRQDAVQALVILDINLEMEPSATENAYAREPKVRDALLNTLLQLSNEGAFNSSLVEEDNIENIRQTLLHSAQSILGEDVVGVLILGMARQDM